jgi:hypothetical protein
MDGNGDGMNKEECIKLLDIAVSLAGNLNDQLDQIGAFLASDNPPTMCEEDESDDVKRLFEGVIGVVEATSYEKLCLWREFSDVWEQGGGGYLITVGQIGGQPICISVFVDTVRGHRILFYEATSAAVDHGTIDKWLMKNLPLSATRRGAGEYLNKHNAMNFFNVFP